MKGKGERAGIFKQGAITQTEVRLTSGSLYSLLSLVFAALEQFARTNSVRDRMRKFTESSQDQTVPTPQRNGLSSRINGLHRAPEVFSHTAASVSTSGAGPVTPHPPPPAAGDTDKARSVGGTEQPAEKDAPSLSESQQNGTPGSTAGQQDVQEEADPDMKTFLTIEIKDGRSSSSSSTAAPRTNVVPITNMSQRSTTNALGQRTGTCPHGQFG